MQHQNFNFHLAMDFRVLVKLLCVLLALNSVIAHSTAEQVGSKLPGAELKVTKYFN